ncbi:MAG: glycosyltransferase [Nitrospinota bacterium]|nr:glycosyltransferase [Nitrospinota bacterium]
MAKIGISCKTSFPQGMGHLVRQTHIAKILRNRGAEITFFIPNYPPAQVWLDRCQFPRKTLNDPLALTEKETGPLDLIILDIQDTPSAFIRKIRQNKKPVVSFEDLGEGRNHVDLLIDCNLGEENSVGLPVQTLFGYPYSVLAPEFETLHSKKRELNGSIESVLITLGGTDPHSLTSLLADKLLQIQPNLSMTLLAGPGCKNIPALKDLETQNETVKLLESTSQMAQTLFDHSAVFCAGGVTLHEAMAVGTPAFVINQVSHQVEKADRAEKQGAAMNLGMAESWNESRLPEILESRPETLEKMSLAGKNLIDGKGLKRVADAIELLTSGGR